MVLRIQLYFILIAGLLFSCNQGEEQPFANPTQINEYFPLKEFMDKQIPQLAGKEVDKWSEINGEVQEERVLLDEEAWRRELDLFIQTDINKASLKDAYLTERKGTKKIHQLKPEKEAEVKKIVITFQEGTNKVSKIEFNASKKNFFYQSFTMASLSIDPVTGTMKSYHVEGKQKVWFLSPNTIDIRGEVLP